MKKILMLAIVAAGLVSCNNTTRTNNTPATETATVDQNQTADMHNAKNSLDYQGTYKGTMPCADREGIEVELKLGDKDYTRTMVYKGKDDTKLEEKGSYSWDAAGNIITLQGVKDSPSKYYVGENMVRQLDMNGNEITGENAQMYILRK